MRAKFKKRCADCVVAEKVSGCLFGCNKQERVIRQLDVLVREHSVRQESAIEEQIIRCPDAFKAGELLEKMFENARRTGDEGTEPDRFLPPPETIIPPFA